MMHKINAVFILSFVMLPVPVAAEKAVIGWVETARLMDADIELKAKIDTGADNSSIHMESYYKFNKNGVEWVRFKLVNNEGSHVTLERKIERYAKIKRKLALPLTRPVVLLNICLGDVKKEVEVNLAKRKKFKYMMLVGRNFLRDSFLVDSASKNTVEPECKK